MEPLLYATIWVALILFVAGQGERRLTLSMIGAAVCVLHIVIAMSWRYQWSHAAAAHVTAQQTAAVYGLEWGGGVYVNYLFAAVWFAEGLWRWRWPAAYAARPRALGWTLRGFYLVVIANAAVVFASVTGRLIGVPLVAWLLGIWIRRRDGRLT